MTQERISMRKLKELFRLKFDCQLSNRKTASSCGISRPTVSEYLFRAAQQGLTRNLSRLIIVEEQGLSLQWRFCIQEGLRHEKYHLPIFFRGKVLSKPDKHGFH